MCLQDADAYHALFNPNTSIWVQKHHPYTGNLDSETSGDNSIVFLHLWKFGGFCRSTASEILVFETTRSVLPWTPFSMPYTGMLLGGICG